MPFSPCAGWRKEGAPDGCVWALVCVLSIRLHIWRTSKNGVKAMADEAHLKILKKGVGAWNQWRSRNLEVRPDLSGADLSEPSARQISLHGIEGMRTGANLSGIDFGNTDLKDANLAFAELVDAHLVGADLRRADLSEAMLMGSDLSRADLSHANLREADLTGANLHDAGLDEADLFSAQLVQTIFDQTRLDKTKFTASTMVNTLFGNVDLSAAIGLDEVTHIGPSTIGIDTIYLSKGNIPEIFLRGAGVPDEFITYMRSLVANPIEYYSCFISYSHKDEEFAQRLYADLQTKGVRCWFAPHDMQGGRKLHDQIDEAIRLYERVLLILSTDSMNSEWVKTEIAKARKREVKRQKKILFPLRLVSFETIRDWECFDADTGKDSAREVREYFIPDFSDWKNHDEYQKAFVRLMGDLKAGGKEN